MSRYTDLKRLRELAKKIDAESTWHVQHAATKDGLSRIDDGKQHGMFPIYGEAYEIEFAAAAVNFVLDYIVSRRITANKA
jgi:hypothetical protein